MTAAEFRRARATLGLSAERLAKLLGIASGRTVRRWESGDSAIPGPVAKLVEIMLRHPELRL